GDQLSSLASRSDPLVLGAFRRRPGVIGEADGQRWSLQLREALHLAQCRTHEDLKGHERGNREARQAKCQLGPLALLSMGRGESREREWLARLELDATDVNRAQRLEQRLDQV